VLQQHGWFSRRLAGMAQATRNLSPLQAIEYLLKRDLVTKALGLDSFRLHSTHALHPLLCRRDSSDRAVFRQIFIKREYRCLDHVQNASLILDCGANCGYSAAYFLSRYPQSFVVAVEPDAGNVQALKNNLEPYPGRYRVVQGGIWPRAAGLVVEGNSDFGDGRDWARAVREARDGEIPDVQATSIGQLLLQSGFERISILKIDIEGSERMVFGEGALDWIDRVDNMVIELHGEACAEAVHSAMAGRGFAVSQCDELTVFCRK
jgi:FkbM family methyltransferase